MTARPAQLVALLAAASRVSAVDRERLRELVERDAHELGVLVLATCHRVEVYAGPADAPALFERLEALTRHLADRLIREPFERLGRDPDGRREAAARELFGL